MKKIILGIIALILASCTENYSQGERIGTIVQFSKSGLVWSTWEGQLNLTQTGMNTSGKPFNFSFDRDRKDQDSIIGLVSKAQSEGWKVKLSYHQVSGWNWFRNRGFTDYFIEDVKILDKNFSKPLQKLTTTSKKDTIYVVIVEKP